MQLLLLSADVVWCGSVMMSFHLALCFLISFEKLRNRPLEEGDFGFGESTKGSDAQSLNPLLQVQRGRSKLSFTVV